MFDISFERYDQLTFLPFLDKLESGLRIRYESVIADASYESEENYTYLEKIINKHILSHHHIKNPKQRSIKMILVK